MIFLEFIRIIGYMGIFFFITSLLMAPFYKHFPYISISIIHFIISFLITFIWYQKKGKDSGWVKKNREDKKLP
jgi:preprotein translocase subunit SecG